MTSTFHCSACGAHFHSLEAFDLHRAGDHAAGRFCLDPDECERLVVATEEGVCRLVRGVAELRGVTIHRSRRHDQDHDDAVLRLRSADRRQADAQEAVEVHRSTEAYARALMDAGS